jgi:PadR family transcriptional regulator PadR
MFMADDIRLSRQTLALLSALLEVPSDWQYGYDLSRRTELKSGTLYPILMRLAEREWLETKWDFQDGGGRPRHMYRLTPDGRRRARAAEREGGVLRLLKPQRVR